MKEPILYHGIPIVGRMPLFTSDNRQAVRDNRKGQTRRPIDPAPPLFPGWWKGMHWAGEGHFCPGVIEHYRYKIGDVRCMCEPLMRGATTGMAYYRDDWPRTATAVISLITGKPIPWRWKRDWLSAMHMPTEAARTVCRTTDIRVEKLQEISDEDAEAEGIQWCRNEFGVYQWKIPSDKDGWFDYANDAFGYLWDSINKAKGYGWDVPQWVFVNAFEKLEV